MFLYSVLFSWQQSFLEPQHTRAVSVRQAQLAAVGMEGLEKERLVSKTHSSPAASTLPHPAMPHRREALHVPGVRQGLPRQLPPGPASQRAQR